MDSVNSPTFTRVVEIVADHSGFSAVELDATSAVAQDANISGDDVDELVRALAKEFGAHVCRWPWHRFAELNEPGIWQLLTGLGRRHLFDPTKFERLEIGHMAAVIDRGEWFEP